jgi:hypothetical protein
LEPLKSSKREDSSCCRGGRKRDLVDLKKVIKINFQPKKHQQYFDNGKWFNTALANQLHILSYSVKVTNYWT